MHKKLTKHERFCKQINQLPTKSHVELEDNSIVMHFFLLGSAVCPWHASSTKRATILPTSTNITLKHILIFDMIKFPPRYEGTHPKMKGTQQSTCTLCSCEHNEAIEHEKPHTIKKLEKNCWILNQK
jgi:hypothetical protein